MKTLIVYDSLTGNTQKVAETMAEAIQAQACRVDATGNDLRGYDMVVVGSLNFRARPTDKILRFLKEADLPGKCAFFITYGTPVWGQISTGMCFKVMKALLQEKGIVCAGIFACPGYHRKFKTYKGRPSARDLARACKFIRHLS